MLKRSIMFISVVLLLFAGMAMPARAEEPQGAEGGPPSWPDVEGSYTVKCNIKFYDWSCNKVFVVREAYWQIERPTLNQKARCWFHLKGIPPGWNLNPTEILYSENGYVGRFFWNDDYSRVTNKPRFSQMGERGAFCSFPATPYFTWVINAKVKSDRKTGDVKSIKGSIYGWGEFGNTSPYPTVAPGISFLPTLGQFEGKFTATPVTP